MRFAIFGTMIEVNVPTAPDLMAAAEDRLRAGRGFAVATLNLDHLVKLRSIAAFRDAYADHDLIVADGNPVVWLSHLAGRPVKLVPGSDMVVPMARLAARLGVPVAMVGSTPQALARATARLTDEVPGLTVAACIAPPMGFDPNGPGGEAVLNELAASGARLCFLALGAPKQELLAARARLCIPDLGFVSVGAGIDFIAGTQLRAPSWVQAFALEWLWRMLAEPRRMIPRYLRCALILPAEIAAALRLRGN
ncbi:MAG: WecB/TagA/CpsF family glycosyltransferase [Gemmobacter sp.]